MVIIYAHDQDDNDRILVESATRESLDYSLASMEDPFIARRLRPVNLFTGNFECPMLDKLSLIFSHRLLRLAPEEELDKHFSEPAR